MPEIKHNFTGGKMNKDLDERLVPNGEYTDAMNIQVSTSEGSDVGTVQNILGNIKMGSYSVDQAVSGGVVVCSIADEKNDKLYYFVWTPTADYILEYSRGSSAPVPVFVDTNKDTLKFRENIIITGVNIIDDMLFWTDNNTEPKKINITRCKEGTPNITTHTKLINDSQGLTNIDIEEKHITVIRKAPRKPLDMVVKSSRDPEKIYTGVITVSSDENYDNSFTKPAGMYNFSNLTTEEGSNTFEIEITRGIRQGSVIDPIQLINEQGGLDGWHVTPSYPNNNPPNAFNNIKEGTKIVFKPFDENGDPPGLPVTDYVIKGVVEDKWPAGGANPLYTTSGDVIKVKAISIDGFPPVPTDDNVRLDYVVDLFDEEEKLFEFKFPRFSYRYKFEDGEYSPFAPFTQVAFLPGSFDYHPRKGYNLGMTNRAYEIELSRIVTSQTPKDVVAVDILFKDETSPIIYVVDTIRPDEYASIGALNKWNSLLGDWRNNVASIPYLITKESIQSVVPSNQLLRPWDNLPRKALAQDVTGNRIVYANYLQNYNLKTELQEKYVPNFTVKFNHTDTTIGDNYFKEDGLKTVYERFTSSNTAKSIKSLREYQLGVVFTDKYGRETPVISSNQAAKTLEKDMADKANSIKVMLNDFASKPEGLTHLKFYVKETSGEYYNMAMDRFYDAEDGNVWLAFPSSDRDKIDIDTFLILKKGSDQDTLVSATARYKVIAIENEAPDFIKTTVLPAASEKHRFNTSSDLFTDAALNIPVIGAEEFKMSFNPWSSGPGRNLDKVTDAQLYIDFSKSDQFSNRYRITSITHDDPLDGTTPTTTKFYSVQIKGRLGDDVNFITNDPTGATSNVIEDGVTVNIYKYKVENKPQFDGRFFVKIYEDETFKSNIGESFIDGLDFRILAQKKVYLMKGFDDHTDLHWKDTDKMLTESTGLFASTLTSNYAHTYWWNGDTPQTNRHNYGYYLIDEFASMATYFRKYRKDNSSAKNYDNAYPNTVSANSVSLTTWYDISSSSKPDIRQLTPGNQNDANVVEYPEGSYWKDNPDWKKEYGGYNTNGYTARWISYLPTNDSNPNQGRSAESRNVLGDDPIDTDVWFIDAGPAVAYRTTDGLWWAGLEPNSLSDQGVAWATNYTADETGYENRITNPGGFEDQKGLRTVGVDRWSMQLSYGGIFGSLNDVSTPDFFNIGGFAGSGSTINSYYASNPKNTTFVQAVDSGARFRWKEDPTGTIYTLSTSISQKRLLRHSTRRNSTVSIDNNFSATSPFFTNSANTGAGATSMAEDLSFNFTSGFDLRNITPKLVWDPVQAGKITGGRRIELIAANNAGGTSGTNTNTCTGNNPVNNDLSIFVPTLTDAGNDFDTIHVGMALYRYTSFLLNANGGSLEKVTHSDNLGSTSESYLVVREIVQMATGYELKLGGYTRQLEQTEHDLSTNQLQPELGSNLQFVQVGMNGYSHNSEFNINTIGRAHQGGCVGAVGYTLEFVKAIDPEPILSENPAIWETEPKEIKDLDVYYEASPTIPMKIDASNVYDAVPVGSVIYEDTTPPGKPFLVIDHDNASGIIVVDADGSTPYSGYSQLNAGNTVVIARPDGLIFTTTVDSRLLFILGGNRYSTIILDEDLYTREFTIPYHNCYSFGNGVESNRIRDNFNLPFITNGVRVSTTLEEEYKEERRKYGLIYSGIYNSTGGINNLNQFIQAEKITKDINPIYGSIQKLHSRDTDLVTLCEDKVLRILANKDAVFNADGNTNLTATQNVLGQTVPFSGEYGISTNPESFASEAYRAYFTDRVRGAVMRLSKDGLTSISNHGMKDWFKDNLKLNNTAFGSYDDKKEEYNLTLSNRVTQSVLALARSKGPGQPYTGTKQLETTSIDIFNFYNIGDPIYANGIPAGTTVLGKNNVGGGIFRITLSNNVDHTLLGSFFSYGDPSFPSVAWNMTLLGGLTFNNTISFKENVKGWVSFKSFLPENALSMGNDYYTFKNGNLWRHHSEHPSTNRNTFYDPKDFFDRNNYTNSSVEVVLNDLPSSIKDFHTLNYEGSQSKIHKFVNTTDGTLHASDPYQPTTTYTDQSYYNLTDKNGWYVDGVYTDKEEGYIKEFLEKEGKWYNNINRTIDISLEKADTGDFTFQGIGVVEIAGCTNPTATNYDANATVDDGTCILPAPVDLGLGIVSGGRIVTSGCMDPSANNYDPNATIDDGSCTYDVFGCTNPLATNYDANATVDDGSCLIANNNGQAGTAPPPDNSGDGGGGSFRLGNPDNDDDNNDDDDESEIINLATPRGGGGGTTY